MVFKGLFKRKKSLIDKTILWKDNTNIEFTNHPETIAN